MKKRILELEGDLASKYRIRVDHFNFMPEVKTVSEKGKNEGKEIWKVLGYYSSLESALNSLIYTVADTELEGDRIHLKEYISELRKIRREVCKIFTD